MERERGRVRELEKALTDMRRRMEAAEDARQQALREADTWRAEALRALKMVEAAQALAEDSSKTYTAYPGSLAENISSLPANSSGSSGHQKDIQIDPSHGSTAILPSTLSPTQPYALSPSVVSSLSPPQSHQSSLFSHDDFQPQVISSSLIPLSASPPSLSTLPPASAPTLPSSSPEPFNGLPDRPLHVPLSASTPSHPLFSTLSSPSPSFAPTHDVSPSPASSTSPPNISTPTPLPPPHMDLLPSSHCIEGGFSLSPPSPVDHVGASENVISSSQPFTSDPNSAAVFMPSSSPYEKNGDNDSSLSPTSLNDSFPNHPHPADMAALSEPSDIATPPDHFRPTT